MHFFFLHTHANISMLILSVHCNARLQSIQNSTTRIRHNNKYRMSFLDLPNTPIRTNLCYHKTLIVPKKVVFFSLKHSFLHLTMYLDSMSYVGMYFHVNLSIRILDLFNKCVTAQTHKGFRAICDIQCAPSRTSHTQQRIGSASTVCRHTHSANTQQQQNATEATAAAAATAPAPETREEREGERYLNCQTNDVERLTPFSISFTICI